MFRNILCFLILCSSVSATTYYVSPVGDDRNSGTSAETPFRLVQHAIDRMQTGDTLEVLDGLYSGTLKLKSGITLRAKNPRKVVFSSLDPLEARFERHLGSIYKARISGNPQQLFYNDQPMTWAQWPNAQWSENWIDQKKWAEAATGTGPGTLTSESFKQIRDLDLSGGYCFLRYGKGNSCYSRLIESFDGTILRWNDLNFYSNRYTGEDGRRGSAEALQKLPENHIWHPHKSRFFLAGALGLLDAPGEWFVKDDFLYLFPPDGKNPNEAAIHAKTVDYCINEEDPISNLRIEGIDFLGTSIRLAGSGNQNIHFENIYFTYIGGQLLYIDREHGKSADKPIAVAGSNIHIERCLFAGSQNSALDLSGSEITVLNCVFMENNRHANFESRPLLVESTGTYRITRNTFFNNCSDAIRILTKENTQPQFNSEIAYNNLFNAGIFNSDVSGIYMPTKSQHFAEVHHNWLHNVNGNALRLDLAGKELTVHHNVFWASKRGLNIEGYGSFNIYNNTSVHNESACTLTRNVLNHAGATDASLDKSFPPIDDWNVVNNLIEDFEDKVGPREKELFNASLSKKQIHPNRNATGRQSIVDRGSIRGNLTGERRAVFKHGDLFGLNLVPVDPVIQNGVLQTKELAAQGLTSLGSYRGAYDIENEYWSPGSDWMPYGLDVLKAIAESESFAKKYKTISVMPSSNIRSLPNGHLNAKKR